MPEIMELVLRMNGGDDAVSYAKNSGLQRFVMSKTRDMLEETLKDMFTDNGFVKGFKMVDFGCSSGPNTLLLISHIMDTINNLCKHASLLEYEVYLNDLPHNDFNHLFKIMLSRLHEGKKNCFVFGLPGSFYKRLLPSTTLHFAYSCYSLHWLSQIPEGVGKNNKDNICIARTSPPEIFKAYKNQYRRDFSRFLRCRGEEMMPEGRMMLAFIGRSVAEQSSEDVCGHLRLLGETLADMVAEGLIKEDDLHSFNVPMYTPCRQEVEVIIKQEGSFNANKMEVLEVPWNADYYEEDGRVSNKNRSAKLAADCVRAFVEPMLACHFTSGIDIDYAFDKYTQKLVEHISMESPTYVTLVVSLKRRLSNDRTNE